MKTLYDAEAILFENIACPANPKGIAFAHRMRSECRKPIEEAFRPYEVIDFGITRSNSQDFDLEYHAACNYGTDVLSHGGIWWAYRFGTSKKMPKNDVPNISITANTTGLDVLINAELQKSQKVMIDRIKNNPSKFDRLLAEHGKMWLKTYLKYEHQPRFYHWILADMKLPGEFSGEEILQMRQNHEIAFNEERGRWLQSIVDRNKELSKKQIHQLNNQNKNLNLAMRLVEPFQKDAALWSLQPDQQTNEIVAAIRRMKPVLDFFVS